MKYGVAVGEKNRRERGRYCSSCSSSFAVFVLGRIKLRVEPWQWAAALMASINLTRLPALVLLPPEELPLLQPSLQMGGTIDLVIHLTNFYPLFFVISTCHVLALLLLYFVPLAKSIKFIDNHLVSRLCLALVPWKLSTVTYGALLP
ncbi:uncharacterized protein LOC119995713 [Tripterygium wilfordii]|uniref:uncharacterized protein LOC119995713 n=1 Tax=Tripterygium wilfordii TaxID=458696 RepID=UPI0018F7F42E|nr:uncharacterized protein LOC119995713 [Tripterygium wilfordii]